MSQKQNFDGTFVLLGFGSIGNAGLDIIFNHIELDPDRFFVVSQGFDRADLQSGPWCVLCRAQHHSAKSG